MGRKTLLSVAFGLVGWYAALIAMHTTSLPTTPTAIAQEPPAPPVVVPPVPVVPPAPVPPTPIASIKTPTKSISSFFATVRFPTNGVNTWTTNFPLVEGKEFEPEKLPLGPGLEFWIFQDPPPGAYLFKLRSQIPSIDPPLDPFQEVEAATIVVGINPTPVPPTPDPVDPVDPEKPHPTTGKRFVLLVRDTSIQSIEQGRMYNLLRTGAAADYLKSKGHQLDMLDPDAIDETGGKSATLEKYRSQIVGMAMPVVVVADLATGKLISKTSLPATAKADDVVALVKAAGG